MRARSTPRSGGRPSGRRRGGGGGGGPPPPLGGGRMERQPALHFGVGLSAFSVLLMGLATNWLAAALLAASILFYVFIYTIWLKPRTPQNIVIGGAAGAFPPLIGWVASTGHIA